MDNFFDLFMYLETIKIYIEIQISEYILYKACNTLPLRYLQGGEKNDSTTFTESDKVY